MNANWQNLNYIAKYGNIKPRTKQSFWSVYYGTTQLTTPLSYPICVTKMKEYRMMGIQFPNKKKLSIRPAS